MYLFGNLPKQGFLGLTCTNKVIRKRCWHWCDNRRRHFPLLAHKTSSLKTVKIFAQTSSNVETQTLFFQITPHKSLTAYVWGQQKVTAINWLLQPVKKLAGNTIRFSGKISKVTLWRPWPPSGGAHYPLDRGESYWMTNKFVVGTLRGLFPSAITFQAWWVSMGQL